MNRLGEDEALSYLRTKADDLGLDSPVEVFCESGQPADGIILFMEDNAVDLVIMSSHGRSGLSRWVYGSVAERVLRQGPCATTIVNARASDDLPDPVNILIPLDGSELAEHALEAGKQLAIALGANLHLLRVISSAHQLLETSSMTEVFNEIEDKEMQEAAEYLDGVRWNLGLGEEKVAISTAKGSPAEEIFQYSADNGIDLIIMSSHGRTGLQRWVYGSVAEKVLRGACCATMIVRDPDI
jgi:nucleotide-binding universal stress UspA family protein